MSSIYDDYPLSDDGLRCPNCGHMDCICGALLLQDEDEPRPILRDILLQEARDTANEEREARGDYE